MSCSWLNAHSKSAQNKNVQLEIGEINVMNAPSKQQKI